MANRRLTAFLSGVARLRPGESRLAFLLFGYFFFITAPFFIVKPIRDASYLEDMGARSLPYAYATAILIGGVVALHARLMARLPRRTLLGGTLVFFALTAIVFEALFEMFEVDWLSLVYWFWANMFIVVLNTQFWILVNDIFNPRDVKRLIGFFGSGGILGGIVGGLLTGFLARAWPPQRLLFIVAGFLVLGSFLVRAIFAGRPATESRAAASDRPESPAVGFGDCFRSVRRSDYLRLLGAAVLVAGIVSTFIDWQSKSIMVEKGPENLASFFGFFNAGLQGLAFLFQLVLTSRFIEKFGIGRSFMIYPLLLLFGFGGIAVWPGIVAAVLFKGGDKALSYSIQQSSRELLYIPIPPETKYRAKIFIDMFLNRMAKVAGAIVLFVLLGAPAPGGGGSAVRESVMRFIPTVSVVAAVFIAVWLYLNTRISRAYVREVKENLAQKWERGDIRVARTLDPEAVKLVIDALESRRESPELFAQHLYALARENKLTPEVAGLLSVSDFGPGRSPGLPFLDGEEMPWVPAFERPGSEMELDTEIREILALGDYQTLMSDYADRVLAKEGEANETAKLELAKSIGFMDPSSPLVDRLEPLLRDPSPRVFHIAAESAGSLGLRAFVPLLLRGLDDPRTADDATAALARFGSVISGTLADMLLDAGETVDSRRAAARLLGRAGSPDGVKALLSALDADDAAFGDDILDALDDLRSRPSFPALPEEVVLGRIDRMLGRASHAASASGFLPVFKLLGLVYDHEDIFRAYQNLLLGTKDSTAYAVELLDQIVASEIKTKLFPRIERLFECGDGR
jgi:AAA family ATP:ADP antiporter